MKKFIFAIILLLFSVNAFAVDSVCTKAVTRSGDWTRIAWTWTSDSAGNVTSTPSHVVSGQIAGVRFIPYTGPVASQPSVNYDVVINTTSSAYASPFDVIVGVGANCSNLSTATNNYRIPSSTYATGGLVQYVRAAVSPTISNAGATRFGVIYLYVKE